jgi:hypothetical protein
MPRSQLAVTLVISTAHRWKMGKSDRGRPRIRAITWTGKLKVSSRTRSAEPRALKPSISSSTTVVTSPDSHRSSTLVRKVGDTRARWSRCSGSSICRMVRPMTAPMIPSYTVEEYRSSSRSTWTTSSKPKTVTGGGRPGSSSGRPLPRSTGPEWTGAARRSSAIRG